jgi:hypothetical protein
MNYYKFYPIFVKNMEIMNINGHLSINYKIYNKFQYKNIKNMHFLYLKFSSVLTV